MPGSEVRAAIKEDDRHPSVPVVVNQEYELGEWPASVVPEPQKVRSKAQLIAVLLGLNVSLD